MKGRGGRVMITKVKKEKNNLHLMPISEAELDSAYGCGCDNYRVTIRNKRCCYKDCWNIVEGY